MTSSQIEQLERALALWCSQQYVLSVESFDKLVKDLPAEWSGHLGAGIARVHFAEWILEEAGVPFEVSIGYAQRNIVPAIIIPLSKINKNVSQLRKLVAEAKDSFLNAERSLPNPPPKRFEPNFARIWAAMCFHLGEAYLLEESLDPESPLQNGQRDAVNRIRQRERIIHAVENRDTALKVSEDTNLAAFRELDAPPPGDIMAFTANLWALYGFAGTKRTSMGIALLPGISRELLGSIASNADGKKWWEFWR
jgi:hypothetical protein